MKRFSNSFWLVEVPIIVAYIHIVLLCVIWGVFPIIRPEYAAKILLEAILLWPMTLIFWGFGENAGTAGVGLVLSFLWAPGLAFWVTRAILKRKEAK